MAPVRPAVAIAYLYHPQFGVSGEFCLSLFDMLAYDVAHNHHIRGQIPRMSGANVTTSRNAIVRRFLAEPGLTHLLFIDSDMVFERDTLDRLLFADAPIVSGLCFGQRYHDNGLSFFTVMFRRDDSGFYRVEDYPDNQVIDVDAVGAACLLIRREVLEDLEELHPDPWPWFAEEATPDGGIHSEDITFCLRARAAGWPVQVHTGVKLGHVKAHHVTEDVYRAWREAQSG